VKIVKIRLKNFTNAPGQFKEESANTIQVFHQIALPARVVATELVIFAKTQAFVRPTVSRLGPIIVLQGKRQEWAASLIPTQTAEPREGLTATIPRKPIVAITKMGISTMAMSTVLRDNRGTVEI
jgi:hypothetical protein